MSTAIPARFSLIILLGGLLTTLSCAATPSPNAGSDGSEGTADHRLIGHRHDYPPAPEAIASFGAAVTGDWLYVYGGHIGRPHAHSRDNLARGFRRLNLKSGEAWEELAMETRLQGLALVAHDGNVYRVGGMNAKNPKGDDPDLHSTAEFARYDASRDRWVPLAPLPEPRSSHDAVVVDGKVYVIGGWSLGGGDSGNSSTHWAEEAFVADLTKDPILWREISPPVFRRRAMAVAATGDRIYVLGGIKEKGGLSNDVDVYSIATDRWAKGPALPMTSGMKGFGVSAFGVRDRVFVSGGDGTLLQLSSTDSDRWQETGLRLETPRFFHRILPHEGKRLVFFGGASNQGHLDDLETIEIDSLADPRSGSGPKAGVVPTGD